MVRLLQWFMLLVAVPVAAMPLQQSGDPPLGRFARWMAEDGAGTMSLEQARQALAAGRFRSIQDDIPAFGIGASPVWMHLQLDNPTAQARNANFLLRAMWVDHVEIHVIQDGRLLGRWQAGEEVRGAPGLQPGLGMVLPFTLPPGKVDLFARFVTDGAMLLPAYVMDDAALQGARQWTNYAYGALYGFVLALLVYNAMVGIALGEPKYGFYALYMLSILGLNLSFNGFGQAWWWPMAPEVQRVLGPVLLVAKGLCGLLFTCHFFHLGKRLPVLLRTLTFGGLAVLAAIALAAGLGAGAMATRLSIASVFAATAVMLGLSLLELRRGSMSAGLFLLGVAAETIGLVITTLTIRGMIDMTPVRYHAVGIGYGVAATLLGLALVSRMHHSRKAHHRAEDMARRDALTGLLNRRGFVDQTRQTWDDAGQKDAPLSLLMLDIDHFKRINDTHGHEVGDQVLVATAGLLAQHCRQGDEVGRWGGEEFVVLLRDTSLPQAAVLAERLRKAVEGLRIMARDHTLTLTVSLGAAQRYGHAGLYDLIGDADRQLYAAKRAGRNRVALPGTEP